MIIRQQQMDVFAAASRDKFAEEAAAHVRSFAPKHTEVLGEEGTRRVVRVGIERAGRYGFNSAGPVHFFLDLMFVLGSEFDADPQYPWASEILNNPGISGPMARADRLHARSAQYLDAVAGPDNAFALEALRRVKALDARSLGAERGDLSQRAGAVLHTVYPQKAASLGEDGLRALIERAAARAQARGINGTAGAGLFIALEFTMGHAFERDPLHPWIESTLSRANGANPEERAALLYQKTKIYLDHAIEYLEQSHHGEV